eukprot:COSAG02_NODE_553_length_20425_cov_17.986372_16_plen_1498_part_00
MTPAEPCAVIDDVMGGYESTVFAYGQTGTGKTHTMEGDIHNEEHWGVIPRAASTIFKRLARDTIVESSVTVSYLEIYNEELCDLLAQEGEETKLMVAEDKSKGGKGVHCHGLSEVHVAAPEDVLQKLQEAQDRRIVGETKMNKQSSRSHCLFTLTVKSKETTPDGMIMERTGKLHMCDLAGSECAKTAGTKNEAASRERERKNINQSLLTLGRVISSLKEGTPGARIPYRDSKLTRLLQESLGGRCKTCIVATISPSILCCDETLSTLNYAQRAHGIKNKGCVSTMRMLQGAAAGMPSASPSAKLGGSSGQSQQSWQELEMKLAYMESEMTEAQAALAKKHTVMQDAVDKAATLERELAAEREDLIATKSMVSTLKARMQAKETEHKQREAELQSTIQTKSVQIEEIKILLAARCDTEARLHAEAAALIQTLDASVADGQRMFVELQKVAAAEQSKREAAQLFFVDSTDALDALNADVAAFSELTGTKFKSITQHATDAVKTGKAQAQKIEEGMSELLNAIQASATELQSTLSSQCKTTSSEIEKMVQGQAVAVGQLVEQFADVGKYTRDTLEKTAAKIKDADADIAAWGSSGLERLTAAAASFAEMKDSAEHTVAETRRTLSTGLEHHKKQLADHHAAIDEIAKALITHKSNQDRLADAMQANESQISESIGRHVELLQAQNEHIQAALDAHRAGQLDEEQLATLASMGTMIEEGAKQHCQMLAAQKNGLQKAVDAQATGDACDEQTGLLNKLHEMLSHATGSQVDSMQGQHSELTASLTRQQDGNAVAQHTQLLQDAQDLVNKNIDDETNLLSAQKEGLDSAVADLQAEEDDKIQLLNTLAASEQKIREDTTEQFQMLKQQEEKVQSQQKQLAAMISAQQDGQRELVKSVMSGVQQMLQEQMTKLSQNFEQHVAEIQATNGDLGSDNADVVTTISGMKQELETINSKATELTASWGEKVQAVATDVVKLSEENVTVAAHLSQASTSYTEMTDKLVLEAAEWGKANDDVAASIQKVTETNEAVVARLQSVERSHSEQTAQLTTNAMTWSKSNAAVSATMSDMIRLNEEIVKEVGATRSGLNALNEDAAAQTQSWGDSGRAVASSMERISEENNGCQSDSARTQDALISVSKAMQEQGTTLANSTAEGIAATAALRNASAAHSEHIQEVETVTSAGFTSTMSTLEAWSDHQAEKVSDEMSQVRQLVASRSAVLEALDTSCASMKKQITASAEALREDTDTQQDVLADACATITVTWSEFCSDHNGTCAQIEDDAETWRAECQTIIASECERLEEYETAHRTATEDSMSKAQAHSIGVAEQTVATTQTMRDFCNKTLQMEEPVAAPAGQVELPSVAREPATTPQDEVLLADCRTKRAASGSSEAYAGSSRSGDTSIGVPSSPEQPSVVEAIQHVAQTNAVLASPSLGKQRPRAAGKIVAPGSAKVNRAKDEAKACVSASVRPASTPSKVAKTAKLNQPAAGGRNPFAPAKVNGKTTAK